MFGEIKLYIYKILLHFGRTVRQHSQLQLQVGNMAGLCATSMSICLSVRSFVRLSPLPQPCQPPRVSRTFPPPVENLPTHPRWNLWLRWGLLIHERTTLVLHFIYELYFIKTGSWTEKQILHGTRTVNWLPWADSFYWRPPTSVTACCSLNL